MDININVGGTITLTANKLLLAALSGTKIQQEVFPLPQTVAEQAARAQVILRSTWYRLLCSSISLDLNISYKDYPSIIRMCGFNNFPNPEQASATPPHNHWPIP